MAGQAIATVFGGTRLGNRPLFQPGDGLEEFFDILAAHRVTTIDTAQSYGNSEATIGQTKAGQKFTIDTKWSPSWSEPGRAWATKDQIMSSAEVSIQTLGVNQVDVFYLHRPDPKTPIAETLSAVNEVFRRGSFRRFGLSGFPATGVEAIYKHCAENDYPLPSVYQGSYNAINRHKETALFPTLRRLGISFYAYCPSAGGFLGKTVAQAEDMARDIALVSATCRPYIGSPKYLKILAKWRTIADSEGVSGAELAYRWVTFHSTLDHVNGDSMIIGASSPAQLEETLCGIEKGPLSDEACVGIQGVWEIVKEES
ncbi:putative aldehyde reductase [Xylariales sp. PMI_506]|nr:putative aldehyde reductase [Xylariales sp. PMI_506]